LALSIQENTTNMRGTSEQVGITCWNLLKIEAGKHELHKKWMNISRDHRRMCLNRERKRPYKVGNLRQQCTAPITAYPRGLARSEASIFKQFIQRHEVHAIAWQDYIDGDSFKCLYFVEVTIVQSWFSKRIGRVFIETHHVAPSTQRR
jgi:hypothetical protein